MSNEKKHSARPLSNRTQRSLRRSRSIVIGTLLLTGAGCAQPTTQDFGEEEADVEAAERSDALTSAESETLREFDYGTADFDRDGKFDLAVKVEGPRAFFQIDYAKNGFGQWDYFTFADHGKLDGQLVPGDYNGDGFGDLAVKSTDGYWRIDYADAQGRFAGWDVQLSGNGGADYLPLPGDYDGDGKTDLSLKDSSGLWQIDYSNDGYGQWVQFPGYGNHWFYPVPADYDGDGKTDFSTKDGNGNWRIDFAANGLGRWDAPAAGYPGYGNDWFRPVPADYDGDGKADLSTKDGNGHWRIDYARNGYGAWDETYNAYGPDTSIPLPADYDADGKADLSVKEQCGPWFVDFSSVAGFGAWNATARNAAADNVIRGVRSAQELSDTLHSSFGGTIFIGNNQDLDVTNFHDLPVKSCVRILSEHEQTYEGGRIYSGDYTHEYSVFDVLGSNVRIENLRIKGPLEGGDPNTDRPKFSAIKVKIDPTQGIGRQIVISGNDISYFGEAGVKVEGVIGTNDPAQVPAREIVSYLDADQVLIKNNFLHHIEENSNGYGVVIANGAYAKIFGNLFIYDRHAIAGDGSPYSGYVAYYNYVLRGAHKFSDCDWPGCTSIESHYTTMFDMHGVGSGGYGGIAGEYVDIGYNTFNGNQATYGVYTRANFTLRGKPMRLSNYHDNVGATGTYRIQNSSGDTSDHSPSDFNLSVSGNRTDGTHDFQIAGGDFDGDGLTDLFQATGTTWFYSSGGVAEWRYLNAAAHLKSELAFGQFDDDPRTDVFGIMNGAWYYSSGGSSVWTKLRDAPENDPVSALVFGDFDGNGKTDVLRSDGARWYFSQDARAGFVTRFVSPLRAAAVRVADFNGDHKDDLYTTSGGVGSWLQSAQTGSWVKLHDNSAALADLRFSDIDGDGRSDVIYINPTTQVWTAYASATNTWRMLRAKNSEWDVIYSPVFGHFSKTAAASAAGWDADFTPPTNGDDTFHVFPGRHLVTWEGDASGSHVHQTFEDMR